MTLQLDMFAAEPPTFPPALDPGIAFEVVCRAATDRDHVGTEAIGRLGNNREIWLVLTLTESGETLACETFGDRDEADGRRESILVQLKRNSQQFLNL